MNTETSKPADAAELAALLIESKFMYLQVAQRLLDVEPHIAGWRAEAVQAARDSIARGDQIVLEISGASGAVQVALVAVAPDGARRMLDTVAEVAPERAN